MKRLALSLALVAALAASAGEPPAAPGAGQDGYTLDTSGSSTSLRVGEKGRLALAIHPQAPWHVDPRAPLTIKLEAPAGLSLEKSSLARKDALDPKAEVPRFETAVTGVAAGAQQASARLKFFLCREAICEMRTRTLAIPVTVK